MDNVILETIKELGLILIGLITIPMAVIEFVKTKTKAEGNKAEIFSLVVGFILSALVAWVFVDGFEYALELGQWVGVGLFVAIGTIGPSGGYKLINSFSGSN